MALIENHIKVDEGAISKILSGIKSFINQPKWLLILLFLALAGAATYFTYTGHEENKEIVQIQQQVDNINSIISNHLDVDDYTKNLLAAISEIQALKHDNDHWYDNDHILIEALIKYIKRNNPHDPVITDLEAIRDREELNKELMDKEYQYHIKRLNNFLKMHSDSLEYIE